MICILQLFPVIIGSSATIDDLQTVIKNNILENKAIKDDVISLHSFCFFFLLLFNINTIQTMLFSDCYRKWWKHVMTKMIFMLALWNTPNGKIENNEKTIIKTKKNESFSDRQQKRIFLSKYCELKNDFHIKSSYDWLSMCLICVQHY